MDAALFDQNNLMIRSCLQAAEVPLVRAIMVPTGATAIQGQILEQVDFSTAFIWSSDKRTEGDWQSQVLRHGHCSRR